jgi:hypothetical protein
MGCNRIRIPSKPLEVGVLCLECTHLTSSRGTEKASQLLEGRGRSARSQKRQSRSNKIFEDNKDTETCCSYIYIYIYMYVYYLYHCTLAIIYTQRFGG